MSADDVVIVAMAIMVVSNDGDFKRVLIQKTRILICSCFPLETKRHVCEECGMRFKKPSALVIHLRTHSGERPFSCELCDKRFSISGNLRRHMFTHTGEKPYKCRACGRAFNNPSHLARHSKKIHI